MNNDALPAASAPPPMPDATRRPIAHWTHTLALLAVLALTTVYGHARSTTPIASDVPRIAHYLTSVIAEWLLLGSVIAGIYLRKDFLLCALRNHKTTTSASLGYGAMVYLMGLFAIVLVGAALYATPLSHQRNEAYLLTMMPHTPLEFVVWFIVSASAGICEELIFRGYLLQQLTAWTRMPIASIFLTGLVFGSVHLYEGLAAILPLAALAVVYGFVVRHFKGDLRAVMVAHTLQDFLVAFLALAKPWMESHAMRS